MILKPAIDGERNKEQAMSRIVVCHSLTLDGVTQALGRPDEGLRGDFAHGGWHSPTTQPYYDDVMATGPVSAWPAPARCCSAG